MEMFDNKKDQPCVVTVENNINRNATYNIINNAFSILFPLITFPYISRVLGAENTGKVNFGNSIVSYFSLLASLGVTTHAIRECASVRSDRQKLSDVASQIFSINILSMAIAYTALAVTLVFAESLQSYRYLIFVQSLTILFTTVGTGWLNTAMGDFKYITIRTVLVQVLSLLLLLLFVREREDYIRYVYISVLASSGANIWNIFYRRKYCKVSFVKDMKIRHHFKSIMVLFSMLIAQTVFVSTDTTILGLEHGDVETGLYGVSTKIYSIVNTVIASVAWVVMPELSELFSKKEYGKINSVLKYSMNIIIVLGVPAITGLNLLTQEIIITLSGFEYIKAALSLHILTVALAFSFAGGFIGNIILLPSKKENIMLVGSMISAVINLVLNLILIPHYGLNAAAATTAVANGVGFLFGIPFVDKNISLKGVGSMLKAPVIGAAVMAAAVSVMKSVQFNIYAKTFSCIVAGAVIYILVLLLLKDTFTVTYMKQIKSKFNSIKLTGR